MTLQYIITNPNETDEQGNTLCWSNKDGWVSKDTADRFTKEDTDTLDLPAGGIWDYTMVLD